MSAAPAARSRPARIAPRGARRAALALCLAACAAAGSEPLLRFERTDFEVGDDGEAKVSQLVRVPFTVVGPVAAMSMDEEGSCSCLRVMQERTAYAAGDQGELLVWATFGARQDRSHRDLTIEVVGVDGARESHVLGVDFALRHYISVSEPFPLWHARDSLAPRAIQVSVAPGFGTLTSATSDGKAIMTVGLTVVDAQTWTLQLEPRTAVERTTFGEIFLEFATTVERLKRYRVPVVLTTD